MSFNYKKYIPKPIDTGKLANTDYKGVDTERLEKFEREIEEYDLFDKMAKAESSLSKIKPSYSVNKPAFVGLDYSNIKQDGLTPQGYTYNDGYSFISAYVHADPDNPDLHSLVYVYDDMGKLVTTIDTGGNAHVGGISIDESNDIMFITGEGDEGPVYAYDYDKMRKDLDAGKKNLDIDDYKLKVELDGNSSLITQDIGKSSTLYAADGKLYISTFDEKGRNNTTEVNYDYYQGTKVDETGELKLKVVDNQKSTDDYRVYLDGVTAVQGIASYHGKDGNEYMVFSSSYSDNMSRIIISKRDGDALIPITCKYYDRKGAEGIYIDSKGNITSIAERGINGKKDAGDKYDTFDMGNVDSILNDAKNPDGTYNFNHNPDVDEMLKEGARKHNKK